MQIHTLISYKYIQLDVCRVQFSKYQPRLHFLRTLSSLYGALFKVKKRLVSHIGLHTSGIDGVIYFPFCFHPQLHSLASYLVRNRIFIIPVIIAEGGVYINWGYLNLVTAR